MWLCTKLGFFSVVEKIPGEFHVRARRRGDLVNLLKTLEKAKGHELKRGEYRLRDLFPGPPKIHRTEPADYRFRIVVSRDQWSAIAFELFASVDYPNFKGEIAANDDQADKLPAYASFHHDMAMWQDSEQFSPKAAVAHRTSGPSDWRRR